jgi:hypothetical protein
MKVLGVILALALTVATASANITDPKCNGVIHGVALNQDGQPVRRIQLMLLPMEVDVNYILPRAITNEMGAYRFENVCSGRFTVVVDDEQAGYPSFIWAADFLDGPKSMPQEVSIVPGGAEVELAVAVSSKAGVLDLRVRNRRTGREIKNVQVMLRSKRSNRDWIAFNSDDRNVLAPSNTELLLRVKADGFREWQEAAGEGKPIRLRPGAHLKVKAQLEPEQIQ